jgi:hypothetical protein
MSVTADTNTAGIAARSESNRHVYNLQEPPHTVAAGES